VICYSCITPCCQIVKVGTQSSASGRIAFSHQCEVLFYNNYLYKLGCIPYNLMTTADALSREWKRHHWADPKDGLFMASFYDSNPAKLGDFTGQMVVDCIDWRVYTEWCCNKEEGGSRNHAIYQGEGFSNWVRAETHLALERTGLVWNEQQKRFNYDGYFGDTYIKTRDKVLQAVVRRAVDFFKDCENYRRVPEGNPANLRVSLEEYIK
jgi:hypothetical protein